MDTQTRSRLIEEHREAIRRLEATPVAPADESSWPPNRFYLLWHVVVGMTLGGIAGVVSLLANVLGAPLFGQRPMDLIRVFLTFPMGAKALEVDQAVVLTTGCILYLATGALFGVLFHLVLSIQFGGAPAGRKLGVATVLGLALWVLNFYLLLSWLQPLLLGGNWIVRMIPWWVGALTHLAFAWTVAIGEIWGRFEAPRRVEA